MIHKAVFIIEKDIFNNKHVWPLTTKIGGALQCSATLLSIISQFRIISFKKDMCYIRLHRELLAGKNV